MSEAALFPPVQAWAEHLGRLAEDASAGLPGMDRTEFDLRVQLAARIALALHEQGLSQVAAARRMGISQPEVSRWMAGRLRQTSVRKLMVCLSRLGYDIELSATPAAEQAGRLVWRQG